MNPGTMSVAAHELLNAICLVKIALLALAKNGDELPPSMRTHLIDQAVNETDHVARVLKELMRGLPPSLRQSPCELPGLEAELGHADAGSPGERALLAASMAQ